MTVEIAGKLAKTTANAKGKWMVKLHKLSGAEPVTLVVKGKNTLTISDVLIGEVWLASAQTNIAMAVKEAQNATEEIASANQPQIRMFNVERRVAAEPQEDCVGKWIVCSPETDAGFAATAYYFRVADATSMTRGGETYFVKGAGVRGSMEDLAAHGGNSFRTWSTIGLKEILDKAHALKITVSAGFWLEHECSWFAYGNPKRFDQQAERVHREVMLYRDHPALLAWGIGSEVEGDGTKVAFWKQIDRLAGLVEVDSDTRRRFLHAGFGDGLVVSGADRQHAGQARTADPHPHGCVLSEFHEMVAVFRNVIERCLAPGRPARDRAPWFRAATAPRRRGVFRGLG